MSLRTMRYRLGQDVRLFLAGISGVTVLSTSGIDVYAATIRVPSDQLTIQQAINVASHGDTVLVAPGTYPEAVNFFGKGITVSSEGGAAATIIDGGAAATVVTFSNGEGPASVLQGFTVRNGWDQHDAGGIKIRNASPTVKDNIVIDNVGCSGMGVSVYFGSPLIQGNRIVSNTRRSCSGGAGGGLYIGGASAARVIDNVIADNSIVGGFGGGIALFAAGSLIIQGNTIKGNSASGISPAAQGGGIWIVNQSDALILQNLIVENSAGEGGGIYMSVPSGARGARVINNTVAGNLAVVNGNGAAIYSDGYDRQAEIINNILTASGGQNALYCGTFNDPNPPIVRSNTIFSGNGMPAGGLCGGMVGQSGNIGSDPQFVNVGSGNYRLFNSSPSLDIGDNTVPGLLQVDLEGNPRVTDANGDGTTVIDHGAYERRNPIIVASDSFLTRADRNLNEGGNRVIAIDRNRGVMSISLEGLRPGMITRAVLQVQLAEPASDWGGGGGGIAVHRLRQSFLQGNGAVFGQSVPSRGTGAGVTWNCPADTQINNQSQDCVDPWDGGATAIGPMSTSIVHRDGMTGLVEFEVTSDVQTAIAEGAATVEFLLKRERENKRGQVRYFSKEGATQMDDPTKAPSLKLQF